MRLLAPALLACVLAVWPVPAQATGTTPDSSLSAAAAAPETCYGLAATIVGTDGNDQLRGTPGDDVIAGLAGNDAIWGEGGNDVICGGPGNDTLFGGAGDDSMLGGDGNDVLHGAEGDDTLDGGIGKNNVLQGGDGSDVCTNGKPQHCESSEGNRVPTAHAGPDQTVGSGSTVTLDGSFSSDADGDPLTFLWSFVTAPAGSDPILSDPGAVQPSFVAHVSGEYVVRLIVNDGHADSAPDTVVITTSNSPPVANGGPDQTAPVGALVTLDGSASTDVDGDALTFHWSLTGAPAVSSASLSDPAAVHPEIVIDAPGTYVVQLIVSDGAATSEPDAMVISTVNSPPAAQAGADQTARVGDTVALDGSGSSDVDGDLLTFRWSLSAVPAGSTASIDNPAAIAPSFTIDQFGTYIAQLVVNDGTIDSAPDAVVITTENSAPTAHAGADQSAFVGDTITLDGSQSFDVDGHSLTFTWSLITVPPGSTAALANPTDSLPVFEIDVFGTYVAQLIVHDGYVQSAPDTVTITTLNSVPVAHAGADQQIFVGDTVTLDGTLSRDADLNPLSYRWSFTSRPAGSNATLSDSFAPSPTFVADVRGSYVAQLIVNDGAVDSAPDTVVIATLNRPPVADAGAEQSADVATVVTLNGGASSDPDFDPLAFQWSISTAPDGSTAALVDATSMTPTFTPDVAGTYVFTLTVSDGLLQAVDTVALTALPRRIALTLVGTPLLGVGRIAQAQVELPVPAPTGGVTVTVTSGDTTILDLVPPGTVVIEEGHVTGLVSVRGVAPGVASLHATAPGFDDGTATLTVTNKIVDLPPSFSVPLGQQVALTVSIGPDPAPAGGLTIQLTTSDENIIAVSAFVTILPGEFSANALVTGVRPGTAIVTATNPDFATDSTPVSTAVQLNIVESSVSFSAGLIPPDITVRLQTSGIVVPAPAPGVEVAFTSTNPECATAPPFSLATGLSTASVAVAYGGTTSLPCTTTLTATSPGVTSDSVTVTVNPQLGMMFSGYPTTVGAGMHSTGTRWLRLGATTHGGTTVRIESANPAVVLVSPNATTAGTPFIEVQLPNGARDVVFVAHGLEGVTGSATITATADKFNAASTSVTIVQPAVRLNGVPTAMTVFQTPDPFNVQIGVPNSTGANLLEVQNIRPGGVPVSIVITSSAPTVAGFVSGATTTDSITLQLNPGQSTTSNVSLKPLSAGTTTVSVAAPAGYGTVAAATANVAVSGPGMTFSGMPTTVGAGMHSTGTRWVRLGATNHGGTRVRVESKNPALVLVSRDASIVGQPFIEVDLLDGQRDVVFVSHGIEGVTGTAAIEVTAAGFTTATTSVVVAQPAARLNGVPTSLTVFTTPDSFNVQIGVPNATAANLLEVQNIRPGGTPVQVSLGTSQPAVAAFVSGTSTADSLTVTFNPGQSTSASLLLKPLTEGSSMISVVPPAGYAAVATGNVNVNVNTPGITFSGFPTTVGAGLQSTGTRWVRLGATNHGGITVRIESSNPLLALVSPNATTVGAPFIEVDLADGARDVVFTVHGLEGVSGNVVITASAPGFSDANTTASIQPAAIRINGLLTTAVAGGAVDPFLVQVGLADATGSNLSAIQNVRPGGPGLFIMVSSGEPAAGTIVAGTEEGANVTAQIPAGQSQAALSFRPLAAGATLVSAVATDGSVIETTAATVTVTVQ